MTSSATLLTLLDLLDGRLAPAEAERVRRQMERDSQLRMRWQELLTLCRAPDLIALLPHAASLDEEMLAAFVENRLEAEDEARVEAACWNDRSLLHEVCALRRHAKTPNGVGIASAQLTARLEAVWEEQQVDESDEEAAVELPSSLVAVRRTTRAHRPKRKRHLSSAIVVAAASLLLIAGYLAWNRIPGPTQSDNTAPTVTPTNHEKRTTPPTPPDSNRRQRPLPLLDTDPPHKSSSPPPESAPVELVDQRPAPAERENDPLAWLDEPDRPTRPSEKQKSAIAVSWSRVRGVIAVLDERMGKWMGAATTVEHHPDNYMSLPLSWAEAEGEPWGRLVIAPDSMLSVESLGKATSASATPTVRVVLHYGAFGVRGLTPFQPLEVRLGDKTSQLRAVDDSSEALIVWRRQRGWLWVLKGSIQWNGTLVEKGQQMQFQNGEWGVPHVGSSAPKWLTRPDRAAKLSTALQRKLLASDDLLAEIHKLADSGSQRLKELALQWSLSLAPEDSVVPALRSSDAAIRIGAATWLVAHGIRHPPARRALIRLAHEVGQPRSVREAAQVIDFLHGHPNTPLPQPHAERLVRLLRVPKPLVRSLSGALLAIAFGDKIGFNPFAPAPARAQAIRAWGQFIHRLYSQANPNRVPAKRNHR